MKMKANHELLGTNKSGSTSLRGPKGAPKVTEPLNHGETIYDNDTHCRDKSIARNGAPKVLSPGGVAVNSGQHSRTRDGALITGQTMTSLANVPDASGARPLDPTVTKRLTPVNLKPGMRSRTTESRIAPHGGAPGEMAAAHAKLHGELNAAHLAHGERVLGEAIQSGSTNLKR